MWYYSTTNFIQCWLKKLERVSDVVGRFTHRLVESLESRQHRECHDERNFTVDCCVKSPEQFGDPFKDFPLLIRWLFSEHPEGCPREAFDARNRVFIRPEAS